MKTKFALLPFLLLVSAFVFIVPAKADGIIIPEPPICEPQTCPPGPWSITQLQIRYHHVDVSIQDQIAVTRVDQVFYNPNDWAVEGVYIFPIPAEAAVTSFTLWIDGEPVKGEVLSAQEARQTYEQIVREMRDPALLEYANRGAVRAQVYPIPPGGERRIELEYTQALNAEEGLVRYIYPLNTEKFSTQTLESVRVSVDVRASQPIRAIYSPSHPIAISRESAFHATASYEESNVRPDTDFALYYSIGENEAFHLLSYRDPTDAAEPDGFFLLLLAARPQAAAQPIPKDVLLVLDRSGSMEGEKFLQAQAALKYILGQLNPDDRFNIITFSSGVDTYAPALRAAPEAKEAAAWVDRQSAVGSTDINRALLEAASLAESERPTYLIFLTDGLPTEGVLASDQILANFTSSAPESLRLFTFGVGYDVDTFLLDSLAQEHHGTSTYVLPGEPLDEILSSFYAKISSPVLTNLQLDFGELNTFDLYPNPLPDLFAGSQIVVVGRYREGGRSDVTLRGNVDGEIQTFTFPDQIFSADSDAEYPQSAIPRLWATRKIGYLLNQVRLQGATQELIDQIVRLSIRYGIVTPYTSYLVSEAMPLGAAEQERIAEEAYADLKTAPAAPSFGQAAVEQAAGEGTLREAEAANPLPAEATNIVRVVGPRTFVFTDGQWMDTTFDPAVMQTVKVAFLSEDYFALAAADPSLGAAFALGPRVIALSQGMAYEVVDAEASVPAVEIPAAQNLAEPPETEPASTLEITPGITATTPETGKERNVLCLGSLLPLAFFPILGIFVLQKRKIP